MKKTRNDRESGGPRRLGQWVWEALPYAFFFIALASHIHRAATWIDNPLLEFHAFRNAQTAISVYYLLTEGFTLDYITPVLGPPWSIPMELPTYQLLVAMVVRLTGAGLEPAGRVVSLAFFYLALVPVHLLLGRAGLRRSHRALVLALLLMSPLYAYWSRTFMIESMALCLSLFALYLGVEAFHFVLRALDTVQAGDGSSCRGKPLYVVLGTAAGVLGALTKITTFTVYAFALVLAAAALAYRAGDRRQAIKRLALPLCVLVAVPLSAAIAWTLHADALKAMNPLADFLVSSGMTRWNFGTLEQRLSADFIRRVLLDGHVPAIIGSPWVYGVLLSGLILRGRRALTAMLLAAYAAGPAVYSNLYYVHEYYSYANSVFLLSALGLSIAALLERPLLRPVGMVLAFMVLAVMYARFDVQYAATLRGAKAASPGFFRAIESVTAREDVLLIYGYDWSPEIAFYAERKAIMVREDRAHGDQAVEAAVGAVGKERIGAMVVCGPMRFDEALIRDRSKGLGFDMPPLFIYPECSIYGHGDRYRPEVAASTEPLAPLRPNIGNRARP